MTRDCPYCGIQVVIKDDGRIENHKSVGSDANDADCSQSGLKVSAGDLDYLSKKNIGGS